MMKMKVVVLVGDGTQVREVGGRRMLGVMTRALSKV
jgi:hypothetical protein